MFELNIRFQIAAMCVLLLIIIDYCKNQHLKLLSTRYFKILLMVVAVNLGLDVLTVYTITHLHIVPAQVNRVCHQFFIASTIIAIFFNYLYVQILANDQKRIRKKRLIFTLLPLAVALLDIAFGDLQYYVSDVVVYSYGQMVYAVYCCGIVYLFLNLKTTFNKKAQLAHSQRLSIRIGLLIWVIVLCNQVIFPCLLLSGFGFVLMLLATYFSFENQKENFDAEIGCFNSNAFRRMMSEYYENGKPLYLINVVCTNLWQIESELGHDKSVEVLSHIQGILKTNLKCEIYHTRDNVFNIFAMKDIEEQIDKLQHVNALISDTLFAESEVECNISIMDSRKYTSSKDEAYELIAFMANEYKGQSEVVYLTDEILAAKLRRDRIIQILSNAIDNDGFEMFYQPIYSTEHCKFESAEALIRIKDAAELGFISPEEFIPIAEEQGMIMDIGDMVFDMVARFSREANLESLGLKYIEVNLSRVQAVSLGIAERLKTIISKYGINPEFINIEITETATIDSGSTLKKNMKELSQSGFSLSMDDFGTGYSNLSEVSKLNYDLIKIDKSMIWEYFIENNERAKTLLDSVIYMLKEIEGKIVAEGIETEAMVEYLTERGVDYLQGYYFSKPVNEESFLKFIKKEEIYD